MKGYRYKYPFCVWLIMPASHAYYNYYYYYYYYYDDDDRNAKREFVPWMRFRNDVDAKLER